MSGEKVGKGRQYKARCERRKKGEGEDGSCDRGHEKNEESDEITRSDWGEGQQTRRSEK